MCECGEKLILIAQRIFRENRSFDLSQGNIWSIVVTIFIFKIFLNYNIFTGIFLHFLEYTLTGFGIKIQMNVSCTAVHRYVHLF